MTDKPMHFSDQAQPVVLYIEDNADNRKLIKKLLQAHGFEVVTAVDGASGLSLLDETSPDLIIMDIGMPHLDGFSVTEIIRQHPRHSQTPIIAVTAHAMKKDQEKSLSAGCNGYIQKPIDVDRFPEQLNRFIARIPARL